ncbi:hypothetical protein IWW38_005378 [Coemansia aciculifera]|uniref:Uncharacterized protein n=1 Tax=Coemansia aciculifera TaxID=417176 RepID=A0ACC1LVT4_9FUNG|nr:hypothetical protein IWW38_005378 [Coemansia aciculifera]
MGPKTGSTMQSADMPFTPIPRRGIAASTSVESLVSSLETPRFCNDSLKGHYDDAATLFGDGPPDRLRQQQAALFETPTRHGAPGMLTAVGRDAVSARYSASASRVMRQAPSFEGCSQDSIGGSTLVQPARVKPKFRAAFDENADPGATNTKNKHELVDERHLNRTLHGQAH